MFVEEWLGKENQLGIDIWKKKYQRNGESFEDWLERVSGGDADVAELIVHKKFLFVGQKEIACAMSIHRTMSAFPETFTAFLVAFLDKGFHLLFSQSLFGLLSFCLVAYSSYSCYMLPFHHQCRDCSRCAHRTRISYQQ